MKPFIIQCPSSKDGKITLTIKELQDFVDKAYDAGKADGVIVHNYCPYNYGYCPYKPWYYSNSTITTNDSPKITWTSETPLNDTTISNSNCCTGSTTAHCNYSCNS